MRCVSATALLSRLPFTHPLCPSTCTSAVLRPALKCYGDDYSSNNAQISVHNCTFLEFG